MGYALLTLIDSLSVLGHALLPLYDLVSNSLNYLHSGETEGLGFHLHSLVKDWLKVCLP